MLPKTLVNNLVEKPTFKHAPSLLGIQGRYIFTPDIFEYQRNVGAGNGGEIQLTDAMQAMAQEAEVYSWTFNGIRYDIGTIDDWFRSHIELSLKSNFAPILEEVLNKI